MKEATHIMVLAECLTLGDQGVNMSSSVDIQESIGSCKVSPSPREDPSKFKIYFCIYK